MVALMLSLPTRAMAADDPASSWAALAQADVTEIHDEVRAIHPGMRDPQNPGFEAQTEGAYRSALLEAGRARSFLDWRSAVAAYIQSFRDGHTFIRYNAQPSRVRWPGFLIDGRGGGYVAAAVADGAGVATGDRLIACDGVPIDTLLKDRLDAREADWSKLPERVRQAWRLFVDYNVDAPPPIKSCRFDHAGMATDVKLAWREGSTPALLEMAAPLQRVAIPRRPTALSYRPDGAALIKIGSFGDEAALGVLERAMKADQARLRAAPYVVFDLRGNAGGNSTWGGTFGRILFGDSVVDALPEPASGKYFRASPEAVARLRLIAQEFRAGGPAMADVADYWTKIADRVAASPDGDAKLFTDFVNAPVKPPKRPPVPAYRGPVYVLTDAGCFSSCVVAANILIKLGGTNVGEVMGQNEEYGEITGPLPLPSGLARYWLPISIIRQRKEDLGGRPVAEAWDGSMTDDAGILAWIAMLARKRGGTVHAQ
ncbi:S41 family peptidase [Sphingomonas sp. GlSt437]|uniref:S41 family peptidase n=2 Tax=Sphingomonas sp. GlSt437 TaxID=3389970 RepID=UPI003EBCC834